MAFVKVQNLYGTHTLIPEGALEAYRSLGFYTEKDEELVNSGFVQEEQVVTNSYVPEELSEDEEFKLSVERKPIQNWSKEEVKKYAAIENISLAGTKSAAEAKDIIKEYLANKIK